MLNHTTLDTPLQAPPTHQICVMKEGKKKEQKMLKFEKLN